MITNEPEKPHDGSGKSQAVGSSYKWNVVGMLWCISFFNYADRQAIFSVFPLLATEMMLTKEAQGWLGSSFAWVYGFSAPFAGILVDRVRRRSAILGGLHVWSLICMATALARSFPQLIFFRAAEGLGETCYYPASVSLLSDYHGKRTRSRALGLHQTSVYIGTIGGGAFAGLIGDHFGWRASFIVFGALGILLGLVLNRFLFEPRRGDADLANALAIKPVWTSQRLPIKEVLKLIGKTPTVLVLMLAFMCANFEAMILLTWMPTHLYEKFHYSLFTAGLAATVYVQLASMLGAVLGGWLADVLRQRLASGRILVQALGVFAAAPCVLLCGNLHSEQWLMLTLAVWGLFKGLYDANIFASAFDVIRPEARGTTAGFLNMFGWLGGGSASVIIGYIADRRGLGAAISSAAIVYVIAGVLLSLAALVFLKRDVAHMNGKPIS